ncbi:MAG: SLATT domain-containing protein [Bosea sp.]|uniref:SLATT domain-containing protein n=1 Tax=unclassified Bosea (in: a-proteobacteria) TaxID=2653178 RepID=UPI00165681EF|nr:SLATT domain-containing protein [Bosea sp. F3-2]MCP4559544.1 SLATT domain-containing protein [Bosea sp. (in: a-proteobacteria)]MCP4736861.1 SLATT domain-containing protein [Bosea sp. (in: a-proteobacteria)]
MSNDDRRRAEISIEALRQMESCLYTSTMIYMWLRRVRWQHKIVTIAPIVLTAMAGFSFLADRIGAEAVAVIAFLATLIPSIAEALDIQTHVNDLKSTAASYKSLQDRFRQLARIGALGDVDDAQARLGELMDRLDAVREASMTPPERYFEAAQKKIKAGHYDFTADIALREAASKGLVAPLDTPE